MRAYREVKQSQTCPYCKHDTPERIIDKIDLEPLQKFYGGAPFMAFSCWLCNGKFHFKREWVLTPI